MKIAVVLDLATRKPVMFTLDDYGCIIVGDEYDETNLVVSVMDIDIQRLLDIDPRYYYILGENHEK